MINSKALYYWLVQVVVWSLLTSVQLINYFLGNNPLKIETWQIVLDTSVILFLSIFFTHQLRVTIKKYIEFDNLKITDGFKIIGFLLIAVLLLYLSFTIYIRLVYNFVYDRADVFDHPSQSLTNNILFIVNYGTYFLIWTVFYVAIKGLIELNKSRETRMSLENNLKESQLNTLKGQINPHFMFNTLNNIRGLMLEDVSKARQMLTNLSETLRYSLTKSETDSIALEDELEMVESYVDISKIQFENRLKFETQIDPDSLNKQIPPMIIQMLIENALKHGISNLKQGGKVILKTLVGDNELRIEVINSGKLQKNTNTTQLGLENIKKRLQLLYGEEASFTLNEANEEVVAKINIPLK